MADSPDTPPPAAPPADDKAADKPAPSPEAKAEAEPRRKKPEHVVVDRRHGFFVRWLLRLATLLVVLLVLLGLAFAGVTLVLRSSVPRSIAEGVATSLLKLDTTLGKVDIGWGGGVTVRDVVLRLPSRDGNGAKLVEVPRIGVSLSALPLVVVEYLTTGLPDIKRIEVERPTVYATQDADGNWNLVQALALATGGGGGGGETAAAGASQPATGGPPKLPPLPDLALWGGKVIVTTADGKTATLEELKVDGTRHNALVYTAAGHAGDVAEFTAKLLPSSGLRQEATLRVANLPDALKPIFELPEATLDAEWTGGYDGSAVAGTLTVNRATLAGVRVAQADPVPPATRPATGPVVAGGVTPLLTSPFDVDEPAAPVSDKAFPPAQLAAATVLPATTRDAPPVATNAGAASVALAEANAASGATSKPTTTPFAQALPDRPAAATAPSTAPSPADRDEIGPVPKAVVDVRFAGGLLTLNPRDVVLRDVPGATGRVTLVRADVRVGNGSAKVDSLLLSLLGGQFLLDTADLDLQTLSGDFTARFRDLSPPGATNLTGTATGKLTYGHFGEPLGTLALDAYGEVAGTGLQHVKANVTASGLDYAAATPLEKFATMDVTAELLEAPVVLGASQASIVLPKATATLAVRLGKNEPKPRVELTELRSLEPDLAQLNGNGAFYTAANDEWEKGAYWLWLEEKGLPVKIPRVADKVPLDAGVELEGRWDPAAEAQTVQVKNLYGSLADVDVAGSGWYVLNRPPEEGKEPQPPLSLLLTLTRQNDLPAPPTPGGREVAVAQAQLTGKSPAQRADANKAATKGGSLTAGQAAVQEADDAATQAEIQAVQPIRGMIAAWLYVSGDPLAMVFNAKGSLATDGLAVGPYELGSLNSDIAATLTGDRLIVRTPEDPGDHASLLGAQVTLLADVPFAEVDPGRVHFEITNLSLRQVASAAALPVELTGQLDGRLDADLQGLSLPKVRAKGEFVLRNLAVPQAALAQTLTVRPSLSDGILDVPIELTQRYATAPGPTFVGTTGKLSLQASYDLSRPLVLEVLNLRGEDYPVELSPGAFGLDVYLVAKLNTRAPSLRVDLAGETPTVSGRLEGSADVLSGGAPFGLTPLAHGELEALATQSRVALERLSADLPGLGDVTGGGSISLKDVPGQSQIYIHGERLDLAAIAQRLKIPEGAGGFVDFSLTVQPGPGVRPKGEVLVNLAFKGDYARFKSVQLGQGQAMFYLSRTARPNGEKSRGQFDFTVFSTERMRFQVANGWVDANPKLRDRGDGVLFFQSTFAVEGMDLAQIGKLADQEVAGDFAADGYLLGDLNQGPTYPGEVVSPLTALSGQVSAKVRNGNLRPVRVFSEILNKITFIPAPSRDTVDVTARLERGDVFLTEGKAIVAGAELRATGSIADAVTPGKERLDLSVVAFLRPLGSIRLPFFDTLDELLAALQSTASALNVTGTLDKPVVVPKSLSDVGGTLEALFGKKNREEAP